MISTAVDLSRAILVNRVPSILDYCSNFATPLPDARDFLDSS